MPKSKTTTTTAITTPVQIGHGVSNYKTNAPSYGFTNPYNTTEFDDELIKRGIVSYEQAMIAKGASPEDARRLNLLKHGMEITTIKDNSQSQSNSKSEESDDDSFEDDDDFLQQYRSKRLQELKLNRSSNSSYYGKVYHISRSEWKKEINEASCSKTSEDKATNVIVHLKYPSSQEIDKAIDNLAMQYPHIKFISINYFEAIHNFDSDNLPVLFVYYNGELKYQDMKFDVNKDKHYIERKLGLWGIIDVKEKELMLSEDRNNDFKYKSRAFGGMVSRFATKDDDDSIDNDIDF